MNLHTLIFTENACYKAGRKISPKGIMVHSTGANNPWLKRYVGPDDGLLGKNAYNNHWNQPMSRNVCVHGFIGKLADGSIATYQTLPWDHRGWHAGGDANNTHISFEICEDGLKDAAYFNKVYAEAVELCTHLCKMYDLTEQDIIDHSQGCKLGIASNHGDVMHWFPKHGKTMDTFRADVKKCLGNTTTTPIAVTGTPSTGCIADEKTMWTYFMDKIGNAYGVAGLMGNIYAESALKSDNLQNSYEKKLSHTDATYTASVDNGTYTNFVKDAAGYGIAQWTYWSRKEALLNYALSKKKSVGDYQMQLDFLYKELSESYKGVLSDLKNAKSVLDASNSVLTKFERPADQSESAQAKRAGFGQKYYDKYADKPIEETPDDPIVSLKFRTGDTVAFDGGKHYNSANSTSGVVVKASKAKITSVYKTGKHPYHCRAIDNEGKYISGVYGWVDEADLSSILDPKPVEPVVIPSIKKGDVVSIAKNATYYSGADVPDWVVAKNWIVSESAEGDRVVINKSVDGKYAINSPIRAKFLTVVKANEPWTPKIGDVVNYVGTKHYANADAANGTACKGGMAKITNIYQPGKRKHPYHLVCVAGKGATVYGWVDEGSFTKA